PFVSVARGGALLPETKTVIGAIARHGLALATGHTSADEALLLLQEGRRQNVAHMVVTHAMNPPISVSIAQMQAAAREGAFIEFVGGSIVTADAPARLDRFADAIKQLGAQSCILSSDLGQRGNALPTDGFAAFIAAMRQRGVPREDLDRMTKANPAQLLG